MLLNEKNGWGDSTLTESRGYLDRRAEREAWIRLKQQIGFGYIIFGFLFLLGGLKVAITLTTRDPIWLAMMWIGLVGIVVTLVFPSAWIVPERLYRRLAGFIGHVVFSILLTALYFILFLPVGLGLRWVRGLDPIRTWRENPPAGATRWHEKVVETIGGEGVSAGKVRHTLVQPFIIITFFIQRGQYFIIPALILMLALGLLLFFVQTSPLAPMIYTLF
jgi:hypothetical protein